MNKTNPVAAIFCAILCASCGGLFIGTGKGSGEKSSAKLIDHQKANVTGISAARIAKAKAKLVVAYWHTSHGSQLVTGMDGMDAFYGGNGLYTLNGTGGLRLHEEGTDIGNPGLAEFEASVRSYLGVNSATNLVMASWCGQVSGASEAMIQDYLARMDGLESDFPGTVFVYMTGHADGTGQTANLRLRNDQIRAFCSANGKYLFDFNDIESYDPDGNYYGDRLVTDGCEYDANGDGNPYGDANWATAWQAAHPGQWWSCSSAHSTPLNANLKAKAAWQLWCAIADTL